MKILLFGLVSKHKESLALAKKKTKKKIISLNSNQNVFARNDWIKFISYVSSNTTLLYSYSLFLIYKNWLVLSVTCTLIYEFMIVRLVDDFAFLSGLPPPLQVFRLQVHDEQVLYDPRLSVVVPIRPIYLP